MANGVKRLGRPSGARLVSGLARYRAMLLPLAAIATAAYVLLIIGSLVLTPYTYQTWGLIDGLFLLNSGWMVANGYTPHIDFPHFYGGFDSYALAMLFSTFGASIKALDWLLALLCAVNLLIMGMVCYRRAPPWATILLLLLIVAVSVTKAPLEAGPPGIGDQTHVMVYNRFGWTLALSALTFAAIPAGGHARIVGAIGCGLAAFLLAITKLTFLPMGLPVLYFLLAGSRGREVIYVGLTTLVLAFAFWMAGGYGPQGYLNEVRFLAWLGQALEQGMFTFQFKAVWAFFYNLFQAAFVIIAAALALGLLRRIDLRQFIGIALTLLVAWPVMTTTGSYKILSVTAPIFAFLAWLLAVWLWRPTGEAPAWSDRGRLVLTSFLVLFVVQFTGPHLLNQHAAFAKEFVRNDLSLFADGPMAGYIIDPPHVAYPSAAEAEAYIEKRIALEGEIGWVNDLEMAYLIRDGISLLSTIPDRENLGVVSVPSVSLPFVAGVKPVAEFPLYQQRALHVALSGVFPASVDAVMVVRGDAASPVVSLYRETLAHDFAVHRSSRFWDLYVRQDRGPPSIASPDNSR